MAIGIQGVTQWQPWRTDVTAADSTNLITAAASFPSHIWTPGTNTLKAPMEARSVSVHPFTAIMLSGFFVDGGTATSTIEIWGCMMPDSKRGPGPAMKIYEADLVDTGITVTNWSSADTPLYDGENQLGTAGTYRSWAFPAAPEVEYAEAIGGGDTHIGASTDYTCSMVMLSTLGFSRLIMQIPAVAAVTRQMFMWRGISKEGVI